MQALTLMNDPTFVEAARFLAARMIREGGADAAGRIAHGFWLVLARPPRSEEVALLTRALERFRTDYAAAVADARALLGVGDARAVAVPADDAEARDLAAYALVAQILLCRDETLMKN